MKTSSQEKIRRFSEKGWWGTTHTSGLFDRVVAEFPDRPALVDPPNRPQLTGEAPKSFTFSELAQQVDILACALYREGLRQHDIVVVQMPNVSDLVALYLALARLGTIISPVPMQYGVHELRKIAVETGADTYISITRMKDAPYLQNQIEAFPADCRIACFGPAVEGGIDLSSVSCDEKQMAEYQRYTAQLDISANDILSICWTSGTTGQPKGVPRSHNHWLSQALASYDGMGLQDGDAMLNPFPLVNMASFGGFFYPWLMCAGKLVLHHPMELPVFMAQLQQEHIAYTIAPPAMLNMLLKQKEILEQVDLSRLRVIASGSAPLSPWMVKEFQDAYGIAIVNVFGSNEGAALVSSSDDVPDPEQRAAYFPRFGVAAFHWNNRIADQIETRLVDPDSGTEITEPGQAGELLIRGANVFDGYFGPAQDNRTVFTEDGFFHTGDLFEIAGEGQRFYHFCGRCKDIIVRGGMKISPEELDTLLAGHPRLAEVAVAGYPDEIMGERIAAVVVPGPGETVTLEDVTDYLKAQQLAVFKLPERLEIVDALPRNPLGKVMRNQLREQLV